MAARRAIQIRERIILSRAGKNGDIFRLPLLLPNAGFPAEPFKPFKPFKTFFFRANLFFQQKNLLKPFKPFFFGQKQDIFLFFPFFLYIYIKKHIYMGYKIDCSKFLLAPSALACHQQS